MTRSIKRGPRSVQHQRTVTMLGKEQVMRKRACRQLGQQLFQSCLTQQARMVFEQAGDRTLAQVESQGVKVTHVGDNGITLGADVFILQRPQDGGWRRVHGN